MARTVTVYHPLPDRVERRVVEGCYLQLRQQREDGCESQRFLLVMPGPRQQIWPGDRVIAGQGPLVTRQQWDSFLPVTVEGLVQVRWVEGYELEGELTHFEAGS